MKLDELIKLNKELIEEYCSVILKGYEISSSTELESIIKKISKLVSEEESCEEGKDN